MHKFILFLPAMVGALFFTGCVDDGYYDDYDDGPGYHGGGYSGGGADFVYVESRPYSRSYGPLYLRDNRYYYSRGGGYVLYDRPTHVYRNSNTHVVNRETNVRNVTYNNDTVVHNNRQAVRSSNNGQQAVRTSHPNVTHQSHPNVTHQKVAHRGPGVAPVHATSGQHHVDHAGTVEKKKKKKKDED